MRTARSIRAVQKEEPPIPRLEGSAFSNAEIDFLLEHLGEHPDVALGDDVELAPGVNPDQVEPLLKTVFDLEVFQTAQRDKLGADLQTWAGIAEVKRVLSETKRWREQVKVLKHRTRGSNPQIRRAAAVPSMCLWDPETNKPMFGGEGADADRVLSALNSKGQRVALHTEMTLTQAGAIQSLEGVAEFLQRKSPQETANALMESTPTELIFEHNEGSTHATCKCPICGFAQPYDLNKETSKKIAVKAVMVHLRTERTSTERHALLLKRLQSGSAGRNRHVRTGTEG